MSRRGYTLDQIADNIKKSGLLIDKIGRRRVVMDSARMNANTYANVSGPLKRMCEDLSRISSLLNSDMSNHREVLRTWYATFIHSIMSYAEGPIKPASRGVAEYASLFDRFELTLSQAFVAADVSSDANYEALEFLGDGYWKNALVAYFIRERRIENESILTVLKHTHENTKALSDLARIFSMEKLVRHAKTKDPDAVCEDVFEAVMGALQHLQWELQRDIGAPDALQYCTDNGFSNRLVRLVFGNCDAFYRHKVPPKTFITTLSGVFGSGSDSWAIKSKQEVNATRIQISFFTPPEIVARIAQIFGTSVQLLGPLLNSFYESAPDANAKLFSSIVYDDLVRKLEELGITQGTLQAHRNRSLVPQQLRNSLEALMVAASSKGYWLGINVPKSKGDRALDGAGMTASNSRAMQLQASLYHDNPSGHIHKVSERLFSGGEAEKLRAFGALFDSVKTLISAVHPAGSPDLGKRGKDGHLRFGERIGVRTGRDGDLTSAGAGVDVGTSSTGLLRNDRAPTNWAFRSTITNVGQIGSLLISHGGISGTNALIDARDSSSVKSIVTLYEELNALQKKAVDPDAKYAVISDKLLRDMGSDSSLIESFKLRVNTVTEVLIDNQDDTYAIATYNPPERILESRSGRMKEAFVKLVGKTTPETMMILYQLGQVSTSENPIEITSKRLRERILQLSQGHPEYRRNNAASFEQLLS